MSKKEENGLDNLENSEILPNSPEQANGNHSLHIREEIIHTSASSSSPIPSPKDLKEYEEGHPGTAEIILTQWQKQTDHRHQMERMQVASYCKAAEKALVQWNFSDLHLAYRLHLCLWQPRKKSL